MATEEQLLKDITSPDHVKRSDAVAFLSRATTSTPALVEALVAATHDKDRAIALDAQRALRSLVHQQTLLQMDKAFVDGKLVPIDPTSTKQCQFCGKEVFSGAILCKHCGRVLVPIASGERPGLVYVGVGAVMVMLGFAYFGLPMMIIGLIVAGYGAFQWIFYK